MQTWGPLRNTWVFVCDHSLWTKLEMVTPSLIKVQNVLI